MAKAKTNSDTMAAPPAVKRKTAPAQRRTAVPEPPPAAPTQPEDAMTQCVALCQEQRWREAAVVIRRMRERASRTGKADLHASLTGAFQKIEFSLRRQMAAAVVNGARELLAKEYLLDVGK